MEKRLADEATAEAARDPVEQHLARERELMAEVKQLKADRSEFVTRLHNAAAEIAQLKTDAARAQPVLEVVRLWMLAKPASRESMGALLEMQRTARAYQAKATP